MKTKYTILIVLILASVAAFADWRINGDIGKGRARIVNPDGTPVANMDALVNVEDYPAEWFAERIIAVHNGELRSRDREANIDSLMVTAQINFTQAQKVVALRAPSITKEEAEIALAELQFAVRHMEAAIKQSTAPK